MQTAEIERLKGAIEMERKERAESRENTTTINVRMEQKVSEGEERAR